jgi:hypothetical protein
VEVLSLRAQGDTPSWWAAVGLDGAPALMVDVGDELVFTPIAAAPVKAAPVLVQLRL